MSDSVRPHRWQPTSLPRPWDSPGKNTGVGCHFLLQCMKVKSEAQSCPTLATPWTAAYQAPPSTGFSRQKYWSGVPLPSPNIYTLLDNYIIENPKNLTEEHSKVYWKHWKNQYGERPPQPCPTLRDQVTVACQAPLSMGFPRQEYRSGRHALLNIYTLLDIK